MGLLNFFLQNRVKSSWWRATLHSACFHMNFGLSLYSILFHYLFPLEVNSSLHLLLLCNEYFSHMIEHFCFADFVIFIYSSAFLGSFCGACFYFPAFNFLLVNS